MCFRAILLDCFRGYYLCPSILVAYLFILIHSYRLLFPRKLLTLCPNYLCSLYVVLSSKSFEFIYLDIEFCVNEVQFYR